MSYNLPKNKTDATPRAGDLAPTINAIGHAADDIDARIIAATNTANSASSVANAAASKNNQQDNRLNQLESELDAVAEQARQPGPRGATGPQGPKGDPGRDGVDGRDGNGHGHDIYDAGGTKMATRDGLQFKGANTVVDEDGKTVIKTGINVYAEGPVDPETGTSDFSTYVRAKAISFLDDTVEMAEGSDGTALVKIRKPSIASYGHRAGFYYAGNIGTGIGNVLLGRTPIASPFLIPKSGSYDRIVLDNRLAKTGTSTLVRVGIYADDDGVPGQRLYDCGTFNILTAGLKELTISATLSAGLKWIVAVCNVSPTADLTAYVYSSYTSSPYVGNTTPGASLALPTGYLHAVANGGELPSTFNPGSTVNGVAALLRRSS